MPIISDYHIHTPLCGHAEGRLEEFAEQALARGLTEIGFSDHAPMVSHRDPTVTMDFDELPKYHKMVENLRAQCKGHLGVRLGIEADFIPGFEEKTEAILKGYPYDYVIGSVHYLDRWAFDSPKGMNVWEQAEVNDVYHRYYDHLRQSAQSGLFDIMAHVELVKKFGHRATEDMTDEIQNTAEVFKETGVVIEINTSGLRKAAQEIYPSLPALIIYCQKGVPVTFASDAHRPAEVAWEFEKAHALAQQAGYREYVLFKDRRIAKIQPL